jgi:hypothetical protein
MKLLAGPILRRIDAKSVNIWMAVDSDAEIETLLFEGLDGTAKLIGENKKNLTYKIGSGKNKEDPPKVVSSLYIKLITFKPTKDLERDKVYAYDLKVGNESILSPLIDDVKTPLGFEKGKKPSFVLPAADLKNLVVAHGSCRKMHGEGREAMSNLDDILKTNLTNPTKRLQQLFLTGDQIYADEIPTYGLLSIMDKAIELINDSEKLSWEAVEIKEKVRDANDNLVVKKRTLAAATVEPSTAVPSLRHALLTAYAKMTTGSGESHLLTFGEYCSGYLHAWSENFWTARLVNIAQNWMNQDENWKHIRDAGFKSDIIKSREFLTPLGIETRKEKMAKFEDFENEKKFEAAQQAREILDTYENLPKVRRLLANVSTYMIFDDHEVTDDWNISKQWKEDVYTNKFGKSIVRNALMAYTLFQDLGNTPEEYRDSNSNKAKLAAEIVQFAAAPATYPTAEIDRLLAIDKPDSTPVIKWHYQIESGSKVKTLFLDTRNRRGFTTANSRPALLDDAAFNDQFRFPTAPKTDDTLFLISACPALGMSIFEELVYPIMTSVKGRGDAATDREVSGFGNGQIILDNEAWYMSSKAFEELLKRMSQFKQVVVFSGDVHYGFTTTLDYWKKEETTPARFIQLVSTPLKNLWEKDIRLFQSGLTQGIFAGFGGKVEKFGWESPPSVSGEDMTLVNRRRLRETPAVIDNFGLQKTVNITPKPEWRYRLGVPFDERTDDKIDDIKGKADLEIKDDFDPKKNEHVRIVAKRYDYEFRLGRSRRLVFASHICLVTFENEKLQHTYFYRSVENEKNILKTVIEVPLVPTTQEQKRPELVPVVIEN